jgi:hypothetical protein
VIGDMKEWTHDSSSCATSQYMKKKDDKKGLKYEAVKVGSERLRCYGDVQVRYLTFADSQPFEVDDMVTPRHSVFSM